jgi:hypothetical protein
VVEYLVAKGATLDARTLPYDPDRHDFLPAGEKSDKLRGWTALAIASGFSYADFYTDQPQTAELLRKLMRERGLTTDGEVIDTKVCLDCLQTHAEERRVFLEREKRIDTLAASRLMKD